MSDYETLTPETHHFDIKSIREASTTSTEEYRENQREAKKNPYRPSRFDFEKLKSDLINYKISVKNEPISFRNMKIVPPQVLIVEGLYALHDEELRKMASMKLFVDLDGDIRLGRWILRDAQSNNAVFIAICNEYINYCRPEMENFIYKTKDYADVILPQGNEPGSVKLVANGIYDKVITEFLEFIQKNYPGCAPEKFQSPPITSLVRSEPPPVLNLADDIPDEQYYDVN